MNATNTTQVSSTVEQMKDDIKNYKAVPLESLDLSARALALLKKAGYQTVQCLAETSEKAVLSIDGFGRKSLNEVKYELEKLGLHLGYSLPAAEVKKIVLKKKAVLLPSRDSAKVTEGVSADIANIPADGKFMSAFEIGNDLVLSEAYLLKRNEDAKQLCLDLVLNKVQYFKIADSPCLGDNLKPFTVVSSTGADRSIFASRHRECIIAYILAKWW